MPLLNLRAVLKCSFYIRLTQASPSGEEVSGRILDLPLSCFIHGKFVHNASYMGYLVLKPNTKKEENIIIEIARLLNVHVEKSDEEALAEIHAHQRVHLGLLVG